CKTPKQHESSDFTNPLTPSAIPTSRRRRATLKAWVGGSLQVLNGVANEGAGEYAGSLYERRMKSGGTQSFGARLKALREAAGCTQEELATIAGLSPHAVSALERGQRRRPHVDTVRALSTALDLTGTTREAFTSSARAPAQNAAVEQLRDVSLPLAL